jgi:hypothetical protein
LFFSKNDGPPIADAPIRRLISLTFFEGFAVYRKWVHLKNPTLPEVINLLFTNPETFP